MTRSQVPARLLVGLVLDAVAIVAFVAVPVEPASTAAILALAATAMAASASGLRNLPSGWLPDAAIAAATFRVGAILAALAAVLAAVTAGDHSAFAACTVPVAVLAGGAHGLGWILLPSAHALGPLGALGRLLMSLVMLAAFYCVPGAAILLGATAVGPEPSVVAFVALAALLLLGLAVHGLYQAPPTPAPRQRALFRLAAVAAWGAYGLVAHPLTAVFDGATHGPMSSLWCLVAAAIAAAGAAALWQLRRRGAAAIVAALVVGLAIAFGDPLGPAGAIADGLIMTAAAVIWAAIASTRRHRFDSAAVIAGLVLAVWHIADATLAGATAEAALAGDVAEVLRWGGLTALHATYLVALAVRARRAARHAVELDVPAAVVHS